MKTIKLTDDEHAFIKELVERMEKQDNRVTAFPMYYVYEIEEVEVPSEQGWDFVIYRDEDYSEIKRFTPENAPDLPKFEYAHVSFVKEQDKPRVDVGPFLTERAAKEHIGANDYHYNKPFVYVNSLWRNWEMQNLLKTLFTVMGKKIPMPYT